MRLCASVFITLMIAACSPAEINFRSTPTDPTHKVSEPAAKTPAQPSPDTIIPALDCSSAAVANPATVYCGLLGYEHRIEDTEIGQVGMCYFPDGISCDEWAFLAGKCGQEYSWCAQHGYQIQTVADGQDPYSQEYAVCLGQGGNPIGSVAELSGLIQQISQCQ